MNDDKDRIIDDLYKKIEVLENEKANLIKNKSDEELKKLKEKVELLENIFGKKKLPPELIAKELEYDDYRKRVTGPDNQKLDMVEKNQNKVTDLYGDIPNDKDEYINALGGWSDFIDKNQKDSWPQELFKRK